MNEETFLPSSLISTHYSGSFKEINFFHKLKNSY